MARMVRRGPWKYNYYHGEPAELFNLKDDPLEFHNLADDRTYRDICNEIKGLVLEDWDPEEVSVRLREHRERIKYLGQWGRRVNPLDPDEWEGMKPPFPDEWRRNALAVPEYARLVKGKEEDR